MGQRNSYGDFDGFEGQRIQWNHVFGYQHIVNGEIQYVDST